MDRLIDLLCSPFGVYAYVIAAEWVALAVVSGKLFFREQRKLYVVASALFVCFAWSHLCSHFRPLAAVGLFPPGSWTTRFLLLEQSLWFRRLVEPSFFVLLFLLFALEDLSVSRARRAMKLGILALCLLWGFEVLLLTPEVDGALRGTWFGVGLHVALTQSVFVALFMSIALRLRQVPELASPYRHPLMRIGIVFLCVALLAGTVSLYRELLRAPQTKLAGVYYYSWFPENWVAGFSGAHFAPPVLPELGLYHSATEDVVTRHLEDFDNAGIQLVLFDWWPKNPAVRKRRDTEIEMLAGRETVFALHYESLALKAVPENTILSGANDVFLGPKRSAELVEHFVQIAETYMSNPNYFRIQGRPVLFVYASRHLVGNVSEALLEARRAVRSRTGLDLYLVGDETFFQVIDYDSRSGIYLKGEGVPAWSRITAFDALNCYNPYEASRKEYAGSDGAERLLADVSKLYHRYHAIAATAGIDFIPGVLPGYNDRGVRLGEDHYVVPREYQSGAERRNFFESALNRWVKPFEALSRTGIFTITSWNEWNEGTQIEPSRVSPQTTTDDTTDSQYSRGETYRGYGKEYLQILSRHLQ